MNFKKFLVGTCTSTMALSMCAFSAFAEESINIPVGYDDYGMVGILTDEQLEFLEANDDAVFTIVYTEDENDGWKDIEFGGRDSDDGLWKTAIYSTSLGTNTFTISYADVLAAMEITGSCSYFQVLANNGCILVSITISSESAEPADASNDSDIEDGGESSNTSDTDDASAGDDGTATTTDASENDPKLGDTAPVAYLAAVVALAGVVLVASKKVRA